MDFLEEAIQAKRKLEDSLSDKKSAFESLGIPIGISLFITWLIWHNLTMGSEGYRESHSMAPYVVIFIIIFGISFNHELKSNQEDIQREIERHNQWVDERANSANYHGNTDDLKVYRIKSQ